MPIPNAQELNELITFQTATGARNLRGSRATLVTYTTAYAKITEMGGFINEATMNIQAASQRYEIWTRWIDGVTAFMQILWGTKNLRIAAPPLRVIDGQNRRWWQIQAEEITEGD